MVTQDRLKELLHYCPETGIFTWRVAESTRVRAGEVSGCVSKSNGYVVIRINGKLYLSHRLAWLYVYGTWPTDQLDHINRVRTDNRLCNLRLASNSENSQNRSKQSNNTSGYIGVSWFKRDQKWESHITINKKKINLGYFSDLQDAIAARKAAEPKYHTFQ